MHPNCHFFPPNQLEYVTSWLDFYHVGLQGDLVGFLQEFKEEQDKGATNFVLPPVPA